MQPGGSHNHTSSIVVLDGYIARPKSENTANSEVIEMEINNRESSPYMDLYNNSNVSPDDVLTITRNIDLNCFVHLGELSVEILLTTMTSLKLSKTTVKHIEQIIINDISLV